MKEFLLILIVVLISDVNGRNIVRRAYEVSEDYDEESDGGGVIDLSHLGERMYGTPDESIGNLLMDWDDNKPFNPEEIGSYLEGDILLPVGQGRSGLIDQSTRWPNGVIPYVIDGGFSKFKLFKRNEK